MRTVATSILICLGTLLCVVLPASAQTQSAKSAQANAAVAMRDAASAWLKLLPPDLQREAVRDFNDADRTDWHFTPRSTRVCR